MDDHAHAHGPTDPAPPRGSEASVRRLLAIVLAPLVLATALGVALLWPGSTDVEVAEGFSNERARGTVQSLEPCVAVDAICTATVDLTSGVGAPAEVPVLLPAGPQAPTIEVGDEIVVVYLPGVPSDQAYQFFDFDRSTTMLALVLAFALAVVAIARWRGLASLLALAVSVVVVVQLVLPALLEGRPPLLVAVVGAATIMIISLYVTHGFSTRTSVALVGTLLSLALTGVLGWLVTGVSSFTGLADESNVYLTILVAGVDFRGLLLAGLVIGALGVLDDVTVTQAAAVWELARAEPHASRRDLYGSAMRIGRSHVQATVNTLVLAYVGASLPLLLIFSVTDVGLVDALTTEVVAQEIVRGLVGSIGIIAAVPLTTAVAALAVRPPAATGRRRAVPG